MVQPGPDSDKPSWRRWAKASREALAAPGLDAAVVAGIRADAGYRRANQVLLYLPFGSEVDITALLAADKRFHLTRTWPGRPELTLHPFDEHALETHPFGYRQPRADADATPPEDIELALVPGLAFDRCGRRLGYGGGYFDRLLPTLPAEAPRIGVTLDGLVVAELPAGPFDVAMSHLATESGVRPVPPADETAP